MSNSIQPASRPNVDSIADVSVTEATPQASRARQKELAATLFKEIAAAPLATVPEPVAAPTVSAAAPRVYG